MVHRARLLVVDDTPENAHLLEALLSPQGYSVALAFSGVDGLEKVRTDQPDVVLLDILMPDVTGYEVCRRIRANPLDAMVFKPRAEILTDDEVMTVVRIAAELGVRKIRLTGGEPTVRPGLVELTRSIAAVPGIADLGMTTNGIRLASLAQGLADAGLRRVNVSLDSLDREKFRKITRWGDLDQVLDGLDAARAAGLTPIKLNAVVVRGFNEDDVVELARLTTTRDWTVRFIEMMPFGSVAGFQTSAYVPTAETMAKIEAAIGPLQSRSTSAGTIRRAPTASRARPGRSASSAP